MKKTVFKKLNQYVLFLVSFLMSFPLFADLPQPPTKDIANGSNDWLDVSNSLIDRALDYICIIAGASILIGVAFGIFKAYVTAHEKQDLGHFFKMLIVGLIVAALGIGLLYAGYSIIPTQS